LPQRAVRTRPFSGFPYVSKELADWFVEKKTGLVVMDLSTPNGYDWKYVHLTRQRFLRSLQTIAMARPSSLRGREKR
jgi:hypothetical protein